MSHGHMWGLFRHNQRPKPPPPIEGQRQLGYLFGTGEERGLIGDPNGWHWQASKGLAVAKWTLWYARHEIGLELYPTHEQRNWTQLLQEMLWGLEGQRQPENPLSDDEIRDITAKAEAAAEYVRSFEYLPEKRYPKNPCVEGTPEWDLWQKVYDEAVNRSKRAK